MGDGPVGGGGRHTCGGRVLAFIIARAEDPLSGHLVGERRGVEAVRAIKVTTRWTARGRGVERRALGVLCIAG